LPKRRDRRCAPRRTVAHLRLQDASPGGRRRLRPARAQRSRAWPALRPPWCIPAAGWRHPELGAMCDDALASDAAVSDELGAGQFAASSHLSRMPLRPALFMLAAAGLSLALLAAWIGLHGHPQPAVDLAIHRWVVGHRGPAGVAVARVVRWAG